VFVAKPFSESAQLRGECRCGRRTIMPKVMEKIKGYLEAMRLTYEVRPKGGKVNRLFVPFVDSDDNRFTVVIDKSSKWIRFWTIIFPHEKIRGQDKHLKLYKALLLANADLAEVKYFITPQGDVGIVGHEGVKALTVDGFRQEFNAVAFGINYFITAIAPKFNLRISEIPKDQLSIYG
jgi:hypothetical protein